MKYNKLINYKSATLAIVFLTLMVSNCTTKPDKTVNQNNPNDTVTVKQNKNVSLISLIANPGYYEGKKVSVKGFLEVEFESTILYLHKEDYDKGLLQNGIWVQLTKEEIASDKLKSYNHQYVELEGSFNKNNRGNHNEFNGALEDITQLERLDTLKR